MEKRNSKTKLFIIVSAAIVIVAAGLLLYFFGNGIIKDNEVVSPYEETAEYVANNAPAEIGNEWVALTLIKGGYKCSSNWLLQYQKSLESEISGSIDENTQYTTYARYLVTLHVMGINPDNICESITEKLSDVDAISERGLNSIIYALIALDSVNSDKGITDRYVDVILSKQQENGGFGLNPKISDVDITAMTLQALARHTDRDDVKAAANAAVAFLSEAQRDNGEFATMGQANSQSLAQVLLALDALSIPLDDARFVKDDKTLSDVLDMYKRDGGYARMLSEDKPMLSATIQVLEALTALNVNEPFFG